MMRTKWLLVALFLMFSLRARAAEELPLIPDPDHLVPVAPYPDDWKVRYTNQIRTRLKLAPSFYLQMLVQPSFAPEYVVCMYSNGETPWDVNDAKKVLLTYSAADKNIWYSMPENSEKRKQQKVTVSTQTADFPKPLAARLDKLWFQMLLRTRYPEVNGAGCDGITYEFAWRSMYGEIWSPQQRQSPLLFIELGDSLVSYCKAAPTERPAAAKAIEDKATQLEEY